MSIGWFKRTELEALLISKALSLPQNHGFDSYISSLLGGIPVERIENPPFHHTFGSEVEFYKLGSGQEWDFAVQDGAVAFFDRPALENTRSFMFWRIE